MIFSVFGSANNFCSKPPALSQLMSTTNPAVMQAIIGAILNPELALIDVLENIDNKTA